MLMCNNQITSNCHITASNLCKPITELTETLVVCNSRTVFLVNGTKLSLLLIKLVKLFIAVMHLFVMATLWFLKYDTYVSFCTTAKVVTALFVIKLPKELP